MPAIVELEDLKRVKVVLKKYMTCPVCRQEIDEVTELKEFVIIKEKHPQAFNAVEKLIGGALCQQLRNLKI